MRLNLSLKFCLFLAACMFSINLFAQTDSLVLKDLAWDKDKPAGSIELSIPSGGSRMAGLFYQANGIGKHPTLLLLHGYPGNERNLDLAQVVRSRGWNVVYFDYRGSWASEGKFSFKNCVEDVVNLTAFCNKYQDSLHIDTSNIVLFGHSMGAWICLKSLTLLPQIKKGFALSTWDMYSDLKMVPSEKQLTSIINAKRLGDGYFVLNASLLELFSPVITDRAYYNLANDTARLAGKRLIMLDEHGGNKTLANTLQRSNKASFEYQVWQTDHSFTNKRVSLIIKVLNFLEK